jgi:tetratricopeptide (TPR) repeat protein
MTDNYYGKVSIFVFTLLFFTVAGTYLTIKTAQKIESFDGIGAFQAGKKIWADVTLPVSNRQNLGPFGTSEYIEKQKIKALRLFDKAIENGYDNAQIFSLRGSCLNDLGFYFDAIEDFDKAIEKKPKQGIASNYHMRSLVKDTVSDYEGSLIDIEEAIRLSKLENADNEFWNNHAKKILGFTTATQFYEWQRDEVQRRLELNKGRTEDRTNKLKYMKRRHE